MLFTFLYYSTIVCTFLQGGWASNQIFKKWGLTGPQLLEEVAGKKGGDFF